MIYSGKIVQNDDMLISSFIKIEEKLNQIFVSVKNDNSKQESKLEKNLKDSKKFDVVILYSNINIFITEIKYFNYNNVVYYLFLDSNSGISISRKRIDSKCS